jgi:hypothetical protein
MNPNFAFRRFSVTPALAVALLLLGGIAHAEEKTEIKNHPFFKKAIGEWSSDGERKYTDGRVVKIKQEWKTEVLGANTLSMEGNSERDGQGTTHYKWTITLMDSGLIEAIYQRDVSKPDTQRYEVQQTEEGVKIELTALLDNNSKVSTVEAFKDNDTLESTVTRTDSTGATIYVGTAVAKRKKT